MCVYSCMCITVYMCTIYVHANVHIFFFVKYYTNNTFKKSEYIHMHACICIHTDKLVQESKKGTGAANDSKYVTYVCVCVYIYIYIYIYGAAKDSKHVTYVCMYVCMYVCVCIYIYIWSSQAYTYIYIYIQRYILKVCDVCM